MVVTDNEKTGFNHDGITDPSRYSRRGGLRNGRLFARGPALDLILQFTGSARQSADVAAWDFTSRPVAQALSAAVARGVKVRLVADENLLGDKGQHT